MNTDGSTTDANTTPQENASESIQTQTKGTDPNNDVSSDSKVGEQEEKQYYMEDISSQWRKFNVDLMPKVCTFF